MASNRRWLDTGGRPAVVLVTFATVAHPPRCAVTGTVGAMDAENLQSSLIVASSEYLPGPET
jgi:hypothetical protein